MHQRRFGQSELLVSALGFGAGEIGGPELSEETAGTILNRALDLGINLVDTARSYGASEARIGRHLAHRRASFVLSTKGGYGVDGLADWTPETLARGIDEALSRMRTDWIDIFHLHSPPLEVARQDALVEVLEAARRNGKIRIAAYSGENDALEWAAERGPFGGVQCSVNVFDQRAVREVLPRATARGLGVIGKRPLGNAPWRFAARPERADLAAYWDRMHAMALQPAGDWGAVALRWSAFAPGVSSVIVGTKRLENLVRNVEAIALGPLSEDDAERWRTRFDAVGRDWAGVV